MPVPSSPKYPVVDPEPTLAKTVSNFNLLDVTFAGAFSAAGFLTGWIGSRKQFRSYNTRFLAGVGLLAGFSSAAIRSSQRLMGVSPNESEVQKYGAWSPAQVDELNGKISQANYNLIDSSYADRA